MIDFKKVIFISFLADLFQMLKVVIIFVCELNFFQGKICQVDQQIQPDCFVNCLDFVVSLMERV